MTEKEQKIPVDKDLRPSYYDAFHCIMGACRQNCCDDPWRIEFDKRDYLTVKQAPKSPEMEELTRQCMHRLRERSLDHMYAEFRVDERKGRCAFHTPEGLCRLQMECGAETLPRVCREFPRREGYKASGYLERALSPGCEAVLALLWDLPEGVDFRSAPLPAEHHRLVSVTSESRMPMWFPVVREWYIDLLQDRRFSLPQRIFLIGLGLRDLTEEGAEIESWIKRAAALPESVDPTGLIPNGSRELALFITDCVNTLTSIGATTAKAGKITQELLRALHMEVREDGRNVDFSTGPYLAARARYAERFAGREYFMENLMIAALFYLQMPYMESGETLWKGYMDFCKLYAFYRFLAVMSCREGAPGDREGLFEMIVFASRALVHDHRQRDRLKENLFQNDSATLAHMAILLCG